MSSVFRLVARSQYIRFQFRTKSETTATTTIRTFTVTKIGGMSKQKRTNDSISRENQSAKIRCLESDPTASEMINRSPSNRTLHGVEVMTKPIKSEHDKKAYRVIQLTNGLKALLISDPIKPGSYDDPDPKSDDNSTVSSTVTTSDEESDSQVDVNEEMDTDEDFESDKSREKLSACALCVDVGSFSDPREVQGLAHFLGELIPLVGQPSQFVLNKCRIQAPFLHQSSISN